MVDFDSTQPRDTMTSWQKSFQCLYLSLQIYARKKFFNSIESWVSKTIGEGIANKHLVDIVLIFDIGPEQWSNGQSPPLKLTICTITQIHTFWPLTTFSKTHLTTIHIPPQQRHCRGLLRKFTILFPCLPCLWVPPPKLTISTITVFDHYQLFPQHTWPEFIVCTNIGIVKVSHKKNKHPISIPPCLCVPPPNSNWLFAQCTIT